MISLWWFLRDPNPTFVLKQGEILNWKDPFPPKEVRLSGHCFHFLILRKWVALTWWLQEGPGSSAGPARKWFPCSSVGNLIAVFVGCWAALLLDSSGNTKKSLWEKRRDCRSNMQLFRIFGHATNLESRCYHRSFFKWQQDLDSLNIFPRSGPRWRLLDFNLKCGTLIITPVWWLFFFVWNSGCWMNQLFDTQNIPKWSWMLDEQLIFWVFTIQNDWNSLDHHPSRGDFLNSWIGAQSLGLTGREMWWSNK